MPITLFRKVKPEEARNPLGRPSLTPQDKAKAQEKRESAGEIIGGTVGAAGGPAGVALGSAFGKQTARVMGQLFGTYQPESLGKQAKDLAVSGATALVGEGVGRAVPLVYRAVKSGGVTGATRASNWLRSVFKPTEAAEELAKLADKYKIPLNIAQRSGKPWVQNVEVALDRSPFSVDTIRGARRAQFDAWEDSLSKSLDRLHRGEITREEFTRLADQSLRDLRGAFNARMENAAKGAAKSLNPAPVTDVEAAEALKEGVSQNRDAVATWAKKAYGEVRDVLGDVEVDLGDLGRATQDIKAPARPFFNARAKRYIDAAEAMASQSNPQFDAAMREALEATGSANVTELQAKLPWVYDKEIERLASMGIAPSTGTVRMPLSQVLELRSELLATARSLPKKPEYASDARAIYTVIDNLNDAVEGSVRAAADGVGAMDPTKKAAIEKAYQTLKQTNAQYREFMQTLHPSKVKGKLGNPAAGIIDRADVPERLPEQIAKSETLTRGAEAASSPATVEGVSSNAAGRRNPLFALRRNRFDSTIEGARMENPATGASRISPTKLSQNAPGEALYGGRASSVAGLGSPDLVARENLLFSNPFARQVDTGDANRAFAEAFPRRDPGAVRQTLDVMGETGRAPQARRAFAQDLLEQSRTLFKSAGDERRVNPRTLERTLGKYGESVPAAVGAGEARILGEKTALGKGITESEAVFGNVSETARSGKLAAVGKAMLNPMKWPGIAAESLGYQYAAKKFVNPETAKWLTQPPAQLLPIRPGGPLAGATGRTALEIPTFSPVAAQSTQPPPLIDRDSDLIDQNTPSAAQDEDYDLIDHGADEDLIDKPKPIAQRIPRP